MPSAEIETAVREAVRPFRLLEHPFYRRWEAGQLQAPELAAYAEQYRHVEAMFPEVLADVLRHVDDPVAAAAVRANLDDELGVPEPHLALFDDFAAAVGAGAGAVEPTPATAALVDHYRTRAADPAVALAAIAAYEMQSGEIATSKGDGLRRHYGLDERGTRFWDVHAGMEEAHADWTVDALAALTDDDAAVRQAATAAARRWWEFLDERESAATLVPA